MRSAEMCVPRERVPLAPFSTLGVGGAARWFLRVRTLEDVAAAHRWSAEHGVDMFVLGGGSNLVIADEGVLALVLYIGIGGISFRRDGDDVLASAGAGEAWDAFVAATVERGLAGLECLSGIPGTVGATPIQNVGAYGQEVAQTIEAVEAFDRVESRVVRMAASDCQFGYRVSRFKTADAGRYIIAGVTFRLRPGGGTASYPDVVRYLERAPAASPSAADVRRAVIAIRRGKGMLIDPGDPDARSVGSFFVNPVMHASERERLASLTGEEVPAFPLPDDRVKVPAAWLIERAGFSKGFADGAAGISTKHPLAIVNRGGAAARDVVRLAVRIKRQVAERFGIVLRPEPTFVGFDADPDVAFLQSPGH